MVITDSGKVLGGLALALLLSVYTAPVFAEGSWQFGLSDGLSNAQPVFEYDNVYDEPDTGLQAVLRPLYVDLLSATEVINVSLCGVNNAAGVSFEIWDFDGTTQLHSFTSPTSNVDCADPFTGTLTTAAQFAPGAAGTYQVRLFNTGTRNSGVFRRFDVTVTDSVTAPVNPRTNQGRLWAYRWAFRCAGGAGGNGDCFSQDYATSADLYAVVDGGFTDSYYVWQLDLSNFSGFAYEITANSVGLDSPNADGTVVAGLSACIDTDAPSGGCSSVSGNRNTVAAVYPIYTSDPALPFPRPATPPEVSNFRFLDDQGVDDSISPNVSPMIQDTGNFIFDTNLVTQGTYTINIDLNRDGVASAGDVVLNGIATPGENTINWNGLNNSGDPIPDGSYNASVILKTGEFHFTAADAETSGASPTDGLTINAVLNDGTVDTTNPVYWDDSTVLQLGTANAFNADGTFRLHQWGNFTSSGDGNLAYIDTYVIGAAAAPVTTRFEAEPSDLPVPDEPKTSLVGEVFEDIDGDGVRDAGEPGIANVVISIVEDGSTFFVTTDTDGNYQFFTRETSVVVDVDETSLPPGFVRTAGVDGETVTVTPGIENSLGLDGYRNTFADITGQVRDDSDGDGDSSDADSGLSGATVELFTDPNGDGDPGDGVLVGAPVLTGADGSYTFSDVVEGNYVVVVTDPAGFNATGDSDGVADNRVAVTRTGSSPVTNVVFLESVQNSSLLINAVAVCINDVPYVQYDVTAVNFDATGRTAQIDWIGSDGSVVRTDTNQPLTGGQLLWPEAAVDGAGNGSAWPGWELTGGQWMQIPSLVRPNVTVRVSVNPTADVTLAYPPATPACDASPLGPAGSGGASDRIAHAVPAAPVSFLAMLALILALSGGLYIRRSS